MELDAGDLLSIRQEYQKQLALPPANKVPAKQFFLCTVGLVGAGKSTVMRPLSEMLSLVRISSDDIRKILKERGIGYEQLMGIVQPLAEELAMRGFSIAFDADCGNPKTKEMIQKLAEKVGAEVFWLYINPPESFILNKLRTYDHTWLFKNKEEAVENYYRQKQKRAEENTHFDFTATLDTSKPDLANQISGTASMITKKLI
ncbi:MAG: AAA family ATPase [bacterium]|nr:AAA family ATPase [bacterium]